MVAIEAPIGARQSTRVGWLLRLPYPVRNALGRWRTLLSMILGVGIALSIGMTLLAVISAEMDIFTGDYTRSVTGTLFGGKHPRIVEIKGIEIEAEFSPHMLYITNDDKPGFIGRLGTLLGENQVNIATFHLGRDKPGGSAIAIVQVDQPLSPALTARIAAVEGVVQAKALGF